MQLRGNACFALRSSVATASVRPRSMRISAARAGQRPPSPHLDNPPESFIIATSPTQVHAGPDTSDPADRRLLVRSARLDSQTWAQLIRLLDAALDQPPEERERWLDGL